MTGHRTWSGEVNAHTLLSTAKDPHDGPACGPSTCLPAPHPDEEARP